MGDTCQTLDLCKEGGTTGISTEEDSYGAFDEEETFYISHPGKWRIWKELRLMFDFHYSFMQEKAQWSLILVWKHTRMWVALS